MEIQATRKPPKVQTSIFIWLKDNLFSTWYNSIFTLFGLYILYLVLPPIFQWAILDAVWTGEDRLVCEWYDENKRKERAGACWLYIKVWLNFFTYGFYPDELQWRVNLTLLILVVSVALFFIPNFKKKHYVGIFLFVAYPIIAFFLLHGNEQLGLENVKTHKWGGAFLTVLLGLIGIIFALPLGIVLALGRRSKLPVVKALSIMFIEFWRGIPLITVLFFAAVMFPLFVPQGVEIDNLLRCIVGLTIFGGAYMAEVVRGGLQALPKGQYEAAQSIGLGYWRMMSLVIMPQALRIVIPGIVNTFIGLFKDTTLVSIISLMDLLLTVFTSMSNPDWMGFPFEGYIFAATGFFIFCFALSRYSLSVEKKLMVSHHK
ncbi:MAG: amino acid ABC transporter permease [Pelagibacteraceae bacterium]|nr:amino acid ABC transporter permease [Pelagibacteraceae bacterium]|tara:strand:+ start:92 stop:1210 length:1119 start_codon:yes stop_codon:yes gene_type:complete